MKQYQPILSLTSTSHLKQLEKGSLHLTHGSHNYYFENPDSNFVKILTHLQKGIYTEDALVSQCIKEATSENYAELYLYLEELKKYGLVDYNFHFDDFCLTLEFSKSLPKIDFNTPLNDTPLYISRFALIRKISEGYLWETPLSNIRVLFDSPKFFTLIAEFEKGASINEIADKYENQEQIKGLLFLLEKASFLVNKESEEKTEFKLWDFHDLLFHTRSRLGRSKEPTGPIFPFVREIAPLPALKKISSVEKIELQNHHHPFSREFLEVVQKRRSRYPSPNNILTKEALSFFLQSCGKVTYQTSYVHEGVNVEIAKKPYPSAGGLYELEIYPLISQCQGLEKGLYYFDPLTLSLLPLSVDSSYLEETIALAAQCAKGNPPQVLLMITARMGRLSWKYRSYAYSLMLKNVGVLTAYMYLFAEYGGLSGCALGAGNADLFAKMTSINYFEECYVGDFILGGRDLEKRPGEPS